MIQTKKSDAPNKPQYIRHKRRKSIYVQKETDSLSSSTFTSDMSSDDETNIKNTTVKKTKKKKIDLKDKTNGKELIIQKKDKKNPINSDTYTQKKVDLLNTDEDLTSVIGSHVPPWGGKFSYKGFEINVINTCTIDNYLFSFWVLNKLIPRFSERILQIRQSEAIQEIINDIESHQWDNARQNWYTKVMLKDISNKKQIDFFGTVQEHFIQYMYIYQTHDLIQDCSKDCIYNGNLIVSDNSDVLLLGRLQKKKEIRFMTTENTINKCSLCKVRVTCNIKFKKNPIFCFVETSSFFNIKDLPKTLHIDQKTFKLLCVILHLKSQKHFISVFELGNAQYLVDDLSKNIQKITEYKNKKYFNLNICSALYYLLNE